ncbi:basic amino acid ABC transporter substrate-binding protein [Limnochorda pilosa]|uniref:Basic amino acid ABC transporter substrate-binding protein n=1 Tax=Limnochorda pilosa TaxID=1555112 RepID=A0A0K2SNS0_LIMPI|nr:basic amino acid ABC transporter substrate-binding protein [Limnochorda pilosa]BAS28783.1 hypothetical protein LIP_2954 [Limnochorda pilosa]
MKRLLSAMVAVLLLAAATVSSPVAVAAQQTLRVGSDVAYPPFEYVDERSGEYAGFDMDLIRALGEKMGVKIEIVNTAFDGIIPALVMGEFDAIISAMTITAERAETVSFSDPYFTTGQVIATRPDETEIAGPDDLKGKVVAVQLGTTGQFEAEKIQGLKRLDTYQFVDQAFSALANRSADAAVVDELVSIEYMKQHPDAIRVVGEPFTTEDYGIAVRKSDTELLEKINRALAQLRADGTYDELYQKWFGVN